MTIYSRVELNEDAQRLMKAHGKTTVYATQDKNYFFERNAADNHNRELRRMDGNEDLEVLPIKYQSEDNAVATTAPESNTDAEKDSISSEVKDDHQEMINAESEKSAAEESTITEKATKPNKKKDVPTDKPEKEKESGGTTEENQTGEKGDTVIAEGNS